MSVVAHERCHLSNSATTRQWTNSRVLPQLPEAPPPRVAPEAIVPPSWLSAPHWLWDSAQDHSIVSFSEHQEFMPSFSPPR